MNELIIHPVGALRGSVPVSGSKNAALPILIATLLCDGPSVIGNLPGIRDVTLTLRILARLGCTVEQMDDTTYRIDPTHASAPISAEPLTERLRASAYFLGAFLGRFGRGRIGRIGGCDFGGRPIDQHIKVLSALGATVLVTEDGVEVCSEELKGTSVSFDTVSVGATVNGILSAVRASGETVLYGAAAEPHIDDLIGYLNRCGANIRRAGQNEIRIRGVRRMRGCSYSVIPDMIEAGTYLIAGAATQGAVRVRGVNPAHIAPLTRKLKEMGADVDEEEQAVSVFAPGRLYGTRIETQPYPGFPTDLQPQMTALLCTCIGTGTVRENIWRHRFRYTEELRRMGANISVREDTATVVGGVLTGAEMTVPDLRAGAALLIAACAARGDSHLYDVGWIERGYEDFVGKMGMLGASVTPI